MLRSARSVLLAILLTSATARAIAAPAMFEASFIFHAWGNDISSWTTPYDTNDWTALPLGHNCQHPTPYTFNAGGPHPRYCSPAKRQKGHPATGMWGPVSVGTGTPAAIALQQSAFGIQLYALPLGTDTQTPHCCRGFRVTWPPYLQSFTYATFANAAGTFFAGGGAAAANGYLNKTGTTGMVAGTWRIRAGKHAFGGAMGLLGKYGAAGLWGSEAMGPYHGTSSRNMVKAIGRSAADVSNPYSKTAMWYYTTPKHKVKVRTVLAIGSGTLWTTGQVGNIANDGFFWGSLWRTGYDNRSQSGIGTIQLVTPTLTHWLSTGWSIHTAQIGILTIRVPEPGAVLLLAAGAGALLGLRLVTRWR